ncbi:stage V sporulation protein AB [Bacillus pacificus]
MECLLRALTEVLNVLPILAKRVGVEGRLLFYSLLLYLEKYCASLFHWIYFVK